MEKIEHSTRAWLPIESLAPNKGQIEGLPTNPRSWTKAELDTLIKSIEETPELTTARRVLVTPHEGKYIILGGNMRYSALKAMGEKEVPCDIYEGLTIDQMRAIVIKDNGSFGEWDYDALGNEWDDLPLTDWGVPAWDTETTEEEPKAEEEKSHFSVTIAFTSEEEKERWLSLMKESTEEVFDCEVR